jgi:hypothetical protein
MFKPLDKGGSKHHFFIVLFDFFGGILMAETIIIYGKAG